MNVGFDLAPVDSTDCELLRKWRNNPTIMAWTRQRHFVSDADQREWFDRQRQDPTIQMYKIVMTLAKTHRTVGVCGLTGIDNVNRRAEFSLLIGPEHQRNGYGRYGMKLLLQHAFLNLGLAQVWGESFDGNPAMKLFDELGFKRDGIRRAFYAKGGRYLDAHLFSITGDEWSASLKPSPVESSAPPLPETPSAPITPGDESTIDVQAQDPFRQAVERMGATGSPHLRPAPSASP